MDSMEPQTVTVIGRREPPSDDVTMLIDDQILGGWLTARITRGIERLPSDFSLSLTELYPDSADLMQIKPQQECSVLIGADLVLTGYVDIVQPGFSSTEHTLLVSGRSKCLDLVDCSAEWPNGQISGSDLLDIARKLAQPYGITVDSLDDVGDAIPTFNLMRGETPFEIIERLCRYRQLLAYDDVDGALVLARVGKTRAASGFAQGINVEVANATWSGHLRYSEYRCYAQSTDVFNDVGVDSGNLIATYPDTGVTRHRQRMIVCGSSGGGIGQQVAIDRAAWEALRRAGRSHEVRLTTDSWRDAAGALYAPNTLVALDLPTLKVADVEWLISEVTYRKDASGTHCDLVIMPPAAFIPQPEAGFLIAAEFASTPRGNQ